MAERPQTEVLRRHLRRPLRREAGGIDMTRVSRQRRRGGRRAKSTSLVAATAVVDCDDGIERGHAQERSAGSPGQREERRAKDRRRVVQPLHEPAAPFAGTADPRRPRGWLTEPSTAATLAKVHNGELRSGTDKMSGRQGGGFGIIFIERRIACQRLAA